MAAPCLVGGLVAVTSPDEWLSGLWSRKKRLPFAEGRGPGLSTPPRLLSVCWGPDEEGACPRFQL